MKRNTKDTIADWEYATNQLAELFITKYFKPKDKIDLKGNNFFWIADCVGETLAANDYFFGMTDIVEYLKYTYTPEQMFDHYDYVIKITAWNLDHKDDEGFKIEPIICIRDWKKLKI